MSGEPTTTEEMNSFVSWLIDLEPCGLKMNEKYYEKSLCPTCGKLDIRKPSNTEELNCDCCGETWAVDIKSRDRANI